MKKISGKNLVLIGFMGTGKTEVGRLLADFLGRRLVDTDKLLTEQEAMSVTDIFSVHGEAYFRQLEKQAVRDLSSQRGLVISTGGGVPLDPDNAAALRESGFVVWLDAAVAALRERLKDDGSRPLLTNGSDLAALYERRLAAYQQASHARVDTTGKLPLLVAEEIMALLRQDE